MPSGDLLHGSRMPKTDFHGEAILRLHPTSGLIIVQHDDDDEDKVTRRFSCVIHE